MKKKILLGLTTTPGSDWKNKIREIEEFNLEEIALFPTFLKIKERKELYSLLEKTQLKKITHVHLRDDMEKWELDLFDKKYKTEVYNIHPHMKDLIFLKNIEDRSKIFVENLEVIDDLFFKAVSECGGICIDISHWEDKSIPEGYKELSLRIGEFKIGCSHISAINYKAMPCENYLTKEIYSYHSNHYMGKLSELDYVKKYVKYLPKYVSIELENSFEEQLKIKDYLEKIINGNE